MKTLYTLAFCTLTAVASTSVYAQTPNLPQNANNPIHTNTKDQLKQAYQGQQWQETLRLADELLKTEPQNADILSIQGLAFTNLNQHENALKAFELAAQQRPDDKQLKINICSLQNQLKHPNAIDICIDAAKADPQNDALLHLIGTQLEDAKRDQEAREYFHKALQIKPDSAIYLTAMTSIDFKRGDYAKALETCEQAIQGHFANNPIVWLNLLAACNRSGAYQKAIDYANQGYDKLHDDYIIAERAEAYLGLGKFEEADKDFTQIIQKFTKGLPGSERTQFNYARTLLALSCPTDAEKTCATPQKDACCGRVEQAFNLLNALQKDKKFKDNALPIYLGHAYILLGEIEKAEPILKQATQQTGKNYASALASLAVALYHVQNGQHKASALKYYQQAVQIDPSFADTQKVRTLYGWSPALIQTLTQIQTDDTAQKNAANKKSGCSCDLTQHRSPLPLGAVLLAIFSALALRCSRQKGGFLGRSPNPHQSR